MAHLVFLDDCFDEMACLGSFSWRLARRKVLSGLLLT